MLTEIYLCHDCSCHDIEDGNAGAGGGEAEPRSFWSVNRIMDVAMDRDHTVLAVCLSVGGGASGTDGEEAMPAVASDRPFRYPPALPYVLRAFNALEGVGKSLDPDYDVSR